MAKYLLTVSYSPEGLEGLVREGGTNRRAAAQKAIESAGGTIESFYFAFGDDDAFVIVDYPDHASAAAVNLTISATGAVQVSTTVLLTPEEMDEAARKSASVSYRPPGG